MEDTRDWGLVVLATGSPRISLGLLLPLSGTLICLVVADS